MSRAALAAALAVALAAPPAAAQPGAARADTPAALLGAANDALAAGDHAAAARLAERALGATTPADRAEALRVLGLARYFLADRAGAEAAFVDLLVLDADAHLDPALVPPEAIVFFEDVRARHAAELSARRPAPRRKRYPWLAPLPIYGQIQNGDRAKAWILGGTGAALLAVNLGSYAWLRRHCDERDGTCTGDDQRDLAGRARTYQTINVVSGAALAGVAIYAIVDGVLGYRADSRAAAATVGIEVQATPGGAGLAVGGRF